MKGLFSMSAAHTRKSMAAANRKSRRNHLLAPAVISLEDRVVMTTTATYWMPSPYDTGTSSYLPVGTVDRARLSLSNSDHPTWVVDYSTFTAFDLSITRNGGSAIDLSNGTPDQYKVGVVGSQASQNTYYVIGLPRVALATGDYTLGFKSTASIRFYNPDTPTDTDTIIGSSITGSLSWKERSGTVAAWGGNTSGQTSVPVGLTNVVDVAAGGSFSLALKADGTVTAWGSGTGATALPPSVSDAGSNVVAIAAGDNHGLALKANGDIVSWGTDTNSVVSGSPASGSGNYFSIGAGPSTSFALGTYSGSTPSTIYGTDGTLITWGQNASFGLPLFAGTDVGDTTISGLVQASSANDFLVGVMADSSYYSMGNVPTLNAPSDSYLNGSTGITFNQAVAGVNSTTAGTGFVFVVPSDASSIVGWGADGSGQVSGTGTYAAKLGITGTVSAGVSTSRLETGALDTISLNSASNSIQAWGYNGNPADNRVSGGSAYVAPSTASTSVGSVSASTIQTLAQVMDVTAPTISTFVAVTASPTSSMPLTYRLTFSKPITSTLVAADFQAVNVSGVVQDPTYFTVAGVTAVSTTIFDVTVGTAGNTPPNFSTNIYLQMVSNANTQQIRDVAGNQLSTTPPATSSTFVQVLTQAAPTALVTTSGTSFNSLQYVAPSTIAFTLTFSYYVSDADATNAAKYTLSILTGTLTGNQIQSIAAIADGTAPANYHKQFTINVSTGNPGTNAAANFTVALNANSNIAVYNGGSPPTTYITQDITSNTVRVDAIIPAITAIVPSTSIGGAVTTAVATGTSGVTVYYKATFTDVVNFAGASGTVNNYFSFVTSSYATVNTVSAFVSSVTNVGSAAYSKDWIIAVSASGTGNLSLTVNPSYTLGGTTNYIQNPVPTNLSAGATSTSWLVLNQIYSSVIVNGPAGLNPSNTTTVSAAINPAQPTYNAAQRSQVQQLQYNFSNVPVANNGAALTDSDFVLKHWVGDNATGSFQTVTGVTAHISSTSGAGTANYYSTYMLTFRTTAAPTADLWSLDNGYYQVVLATPSNIKDVNNVVYTAGSATWQAQSEYYRLFGDANGNGAIDNDDATKIGVAFNDGTNSWASWSFFALLDNLVVYADGELNNNDVTAFSTAYNNGSSVDGRVVN